MFSSPPPKTYHLQPLPVIHKTIQQLGVRTKRELERYLNEYSAAQARNRGLYAAQGERERKTWDAEAPQTYQKREGAEGCRLAGMESPLLKARLHLTKKEREQEALGVDIGDRSSFQIKKGIMGHDEDGEEGDKHTYVVTSRENGTHRKQVQNDENDDDNVREENERSNRLAQRRARRRAKKEIISPSTPMMVSMSEYQGPSRKRKRDEEKDRDNDGDRGTRKTKKRKGKVTLGISLMENFTARNVGHGRLTLPPPNHAGLFNKGRASVKTDIRKYGKENRRPANIFSEFEFLNRPNTFRGRDDECASSSSQSSVGCESSCSILSPTKIRCQAGKGIKCPRERKTIETSFPPDMLKHRTTKKPPSRSDTSWERHSASWGLGSVLPSDDESVRAAPPRPSREPRQPTLTAEEIVDQGTIPGAPSRQGSPELVIMTVPSKWRFDDADDAGGSFQPQALAKQTTLQDTTASRSRFFPARVPSQDLPLPSPPQVPDANEQSLQEFQEELSIVQAEFSASPSGDLHPEASYPEAPNPLEMAADDPHIAHSPLSDGPIPLEEHTTNVRSMGDPILPANSGLTMAHFIDEHLGTEDDFDVPTMDCLDFCGDPLLSPNAQRLQEPVERQGGGSALGLQLGRQYRGTFNGQDVDGSVWHDAWDWEDATRWNDNTGIEGGSYDDPLSYSQDHRQAACDQSMDHSGSVLAGVDQEAYCQAWPTNMLAQERGLPNEGQYEGSIGYEGQESEEEDAMLEFSEGRTLLMGMADGILAEKPSRRPELEKIHREPYRLQFGQSVKEIEVMVGKDLGNLWKR